MPTGNGPGESALIENVRGVLESGGYVGRGARLLVGVSGGPDSTALLSSLVELRESCEIDLHVTHVDHGLRPESGGDAAYVRRLCARWNVPTTVRRVDVDNLRREERLSIEEAARTARRHTYSHKGGDRSTDADVPLSWGTRRMIRWKRCVAESTARRGSAWAGGDGRAIRIGVHAAGRQTGSHHSPAAEHDAR